MMKRPSECPKCQEKVLWNLKESRRSGYSIPKGLLGFLFFNVVGLLAGFLGKERKTYHCGKCGYEEEY